MLSPEELQKLEIKPEVLELVPMSVALRDAVLPVSIESTAIYLILPAGLSDRDLFELEEKLAFLLNRSISFDLADRDELEKAIDFHYSFAFASIQNCEHSFKYRCPKIWLKLEPTSVPNERWCPTCEKTVTFCFTEEDLKRLSIKGECVAFNEDSESCETLGLLDFPE
ncbi:MAG: hypothetical protein Tsb009_12740 [Planctomycetaceae bacterium]